MFRRFSFLYDLQSGISPGGNRFHRVIRQDNIEALTDFIENQENKSLNELSTQVDNIGKIPFTVLSECQALKSDEELAGELYNKVFSITKSKKLPKLSETLNIEDNFSLNMQFAVFALNEARKMIQHSYTHWLINSNNNKQEGRYLFKKINEVREKTLERCSSKDEYYACLADIALKESAGDCGEFCSVVCKIIKDQNFPVTSEIFVIINGDHAFNVIGRDNNTDINNYKSWNDDVVILDAWSGQVFFKEQFEERLKDFKRLNYNSTNKYVLTEVNTQFHKFDIIFGQKPQECQKKISIKRG